VSIGFFSTEEFTFPIIQTTIRKLRKNKNNSAKRVQQALGVLTLRFTVSSPRMPTASDTSELCKLARIALEVTT